MKTMTKCFLGCVIAGLLTLLSGCMNMAATGAEAVYNRHTIQKNLNDQWVTMQVYHQLHFKSDDFKNANISITTFNNEVLLAGQTPQEWQRTRAEEIVKKLTGVNTVYNFLTLESPSSTLTRISDSWITTKVKSHLITSDDVEASQIKVVTENGTVFLMGTITPEAAKAAVKIAGNTAGVKSVIKIFSYIHISKEEPGRA